MQKTNLKTLTLITADKGYEEAMKRPGDTAIPPNLPLKREELPLFCKEGIGEISRICSYYFETISIIAVILHFPYQRLFVPACIALQGGTFDTDDGECIMIHTDKPRP
jgi:hypothetical protein